MDHILDKSLFSYDSKYHLGYLANKLAAPPSSGRGLFRNKDEMS